MQKTDIVPDLKKRIENTYKGLIENDESLKRLTEKIHEAGTWEDAQEYAGIIGSHRSTSFLENISSEDLPNGQMYYNIANRIIPPALESDYEQVSEVCMEVQEQANEAARIGIKAQKADLNRDRIDGIVNRISSEPFDVVFWLLGAPIQNFMRSVVDDHVEENADFQYKSGLQPVIKRTTDGKCCKWCSERAGTYPYKPDMDRDVFRRHENCGCTVAYYPDVKSKERQDVRNKQWYETETDQKSQNRALSQRKQKISVKAKSKTVESDLDNQTITQIEKSIRNLNKQIEKHKEKIEHPELIYPEWGTYNEIQQEGFKKHWKKEITNFEIQIERRKREIERRRSAHG